MCVGVRKQTATQTNNPTPLHHNHPLRHTPTNRIPTNRIFALDDPAEEDNDHVVFNGSRVVGRRLHQPIHSRPLDCTVIVSLTSTYLIH